jgi:UDP-N-acetylglucosamine acyltransferase
MAIDPSATLHPTAIVEDGAVVGPGCRIGPYCTIGAEVVLGPGVTLHSHVALAGRTRIGEGTTVWPFASLGHAPQDLKYAGEPTELVIGARNMIRESVTMSPGTAGGGGVTTVGDDGLFMMNTHVAHDCRLGNRVILANGAALGGHVVVEDGVILGGLAAVHQFVRLGTGAMIGGLAGVVADVIPYGMVMGERGHLVGLNLVGLKRRNLERREIAALRAAFAEIEKGQGPFLDRVRRAGEAHPASLLVQEVVRFVTSGSARSFTVPPAGGDG